MCRRSTPPADAPPGTLLFVFHYGTGSFNDHQANAMYDSTGAPLSLAVVSFENPETDNEIGYVFAIGLAKVDTTARPDSGAGIKVIAPTGTDKRNLKPQLLTTADVAAGRRLADYLWKLQLRASCASTPPAPGG